MTNDPILNIIHSLIGGKQNYVSPLPSRQNIQSPIPTQDLDPNLRMNQGNGQDTRFATPGIQLAMQAMVDAYKNSQKPYHMDFAKQRALDVLKQSQQALKTTTGIEGQATSPFIADNPDFAYAQPVDQAATKYGIPPEILAAALARESMQFQDKYVHGYHVDGTGRGIAGIDSKWHPEVTDEQAFDPNFSIDWMGKKLSDLKASTNGDMYSALRMYNGGNDYDSPRIGYGGRSVRENTTRHADSIMEQAQNYIKKKSVAKN